MSAEIFLPLTKVNVEKRLIYGVVTAEIPDRAGEVMDYTSSKPFFEAWSAEALAASGGKSKGNLRAMHGKIAAGKVTEINFNDDAKQIEIAAKVVDDAEWNKVLEGVYTGFSQGGRYVKRWPDKDTELVRYTAEPMEISLVDLPCLPEATFEVVKDGVIEKRAFASASMTDTDRRRAEICKCAEANVAAMTAPLTEALAEVVRIVNGLYKDTPQYRADLAKIRRCGTVDDDEPLPAKASILAPPKTAESAAAAEETRIAKLSPEEKAFELTKLALRNPTRGRTKT